MRLTILAAGMLLVVGCTPKKPVVAAVAPPAVAPGQRQLPKEYVDLQAGWRLQIIAPITVDGTANVVDEKAAASSDQDSRTVSLKMSKNMIGYETGFWELDARPGGGVRIRLASAIMTKEGVPAPIAAPAKALLHVTKQARFLRLFYLIRKSESDHEIVIAGFDKTERIEPFTTALKTNPAETCHNTAHIYCEWIPYGMAVRPEVKKNDTWSPVH